MGNELKELEKVGEEKKIDTSDERKAFDLEEEEVKEEVKEEGEETDEPPEEDEEEKTEESEEKDEEDTDEEETLEDDSLYQKIKAAHPKILKEIPELRSTIFREQQYTELLPTIEDARDAVEAKEVLNGLQAEIQSGKSETFLKSVNELGALDTFLSTFTDSLQKVSKDTYLNFMYPEFKKMLRVAANSDDERISVAATNIHYFIFGDTNLKADVGLKVKENPEDERVNKREQEFEFKQYNAAINDIKNVCEKRLKFQIMKPLQAAGLSKLQGKLLEDEIFKRVDTAVAKDVRHMGNIRHLWERARKEGYTSEGKDRITNAYLSRAKLLVPKYRQQVLSEAKIKVATDGKEKKPVTRVPVSTSVKTQEVGTQKIDPKKIDWSKTTEEDLLNGKYVLKG